MEADMNLSNSEMSSTTSESEQGLIDRNNLAYNIEEMKLTVDIDCDDPMKLYELFLTHSIMQQVVDETNKFSEQMDTPSTSKANQKQWTHITIDEMKIFIGILLIMGVVHVPDIQKYWSKNTMYTNIRIKNAMTRDRFRVIMQHWLFFGDQELSDDRLREVKKILEEINNNIKKAVIPGNDVIIDESIVSFCDRLYFHQYIAIEKHKNGGKFYKLCIPKGYTYNLEVCAKKSQSKDSEKNRAYNVGLSLMVGLLNKGRIVYMDNCYLNDPLNKRDIFCLKNRGAEYFKLTDRGKKELDTTLNCSNFETSVESSDQMSAYYTSLRKTIKSYRKIIMEIICGVMLVNAWVIHQKWGKEKKNIVQFRESVIDELLNNLSVSNSIATMGPITKQHILREFDGPSSKNRKRCRGCYENLVKTNGRRYATNSTKKVKTYCATCKHKPVLCLKCFEQLHK